MTFHTILPVVIHSLLNEGDGTEKSACPDEDRGLPTGRYSKPQLNFCPFPRFRVYMNFSLMHSHDLPAQA
jgi:hypothetical protein